jgi:cytochrome c-type biogenesis protein CcmH/NrfF
MTKLKDLEMRTCLIWMVVAILVVGIPIMMVRANKQLAQTRTAFEKSNDDLKALGADIPKSN